LGYGQQRSVGVAAVCRTIARIPTSVSWTANSLKPPRRRVMVAKVGITVAAVDMARWGVEGVGGVVVLRCLRAAASGVGGSGNSQKHRRGVIPRGDFYSPWVRGVVAVWTGPSTEVNTRRVRSNLLPSCNFSSVVGCFRI
jgi:hypothetical protein